MAKGGQTYYVYYEDSRDKTHSSKSVWAESEDEARKKFLSRHDFCTIEGVESLDDIVKKSRKNLEKQLEEYYNKLGLDTEEKREEYGRKRRAEREEQEKRERRNGFISDVGSFIGGLFGKYTDYANQQMYGVDTSQMSNQDKFRVFHENRTKD